MFMRCTWLPELVLCTNWAKYKEYESILYSIFCDDFINTHPVFEGKQVNIRKHPQVDNREQTFYHVTSKDYHADADRCPDPKRCERIRWIRAFIENYHCDPLKCEACDGIKVWDEAYGNNSRVFLLSEEENYMVVIERRVQYVLLITAFYFDYPHALEKQLKKYNNYIKTKRA